MKTKLIAIVTLVASLAFSQAAEKIQAPNGGRIIDAVEPHAEFLVTKEKKVEIRFLDDAGKVVAPAEQTASIVMGDRAAPTKLAFTKDGDKLVSDKTVPDGAGLPVVLTIKTKPDAKAVNAKFNLNMAVCPGCKLSEYACTCEHSEKDAHHDHDHKEGDGHKH